MSSPKSDDRESLEALFATLDHSQRGGRPAAQLAASWRFAGIAASEVRAWIEVGIFDGHRAGLLKLAGVGADDLAAIPDGHKLGFAFAMGQLSVTEVCNLVTMFEKSRLANSNPQSSHVRPSEPRATDRADDDHEDEA